MHNNSSEVNYLQLFLTLLVLHTEAHIQRAVWISSWLSFNYITVKETTKQKQ